MLERIGNAIIDLLKVRTIITIMIVGVICYLAIVSRIEIVAFVAIATQIINYYFTRKENQDKVE